jgi:predicted DNA-binding transcriptional regulator AlpA
LQFFGYVPPARVYHKPVSTTKILNKNEVIALLGRSKRTIDTYMADGRLPYHYVQGLNGRQSAFLAADVENLKRDLEAPIPVERIERGVVERTPHAVATNGGVPSGSEAQALSAVEAICQFVKLSAGAQTATDAVYVSMRDAVRITGLSATTIRALAPTEVKTRPYGGGVRYRRADLEAL